MTEQYLGTKMKNSRSGSPLVTTKIENSIACVNLVVYIIEQRNITMNGFRTAINMLRSANIRSMSFLRIISNFFRAYKRKYDSLKLQVKSNKGSFLKGQINRSFPSLSN